MTAIKRDITIGPVRMILGDCRDVLPQLGSVADLCVTDLPYKLISGGNGAQSMGGMFSSDAYDNGGDLMAMLAWSEMGGPIFRALKPDADCYIMTNDKNLFAAGGAFLGAGFKLHNVLVWDKIRATRNRWYMKNLEFTIYLWKGRARRISNAGSKQLFTLNAKKATRHPTEKPVALMAHYIENSSLSDDLVLDPCSGSGATMLACLDTGRRGIGIEIDPEWFEVSVERLRAKWTDMQACGVDLS